MKYDNFYDAWQFLEDHPMFKAEADRTVAGRNGFFQQCLDILVVRVNPATDEIDDNKALNTKTAVWLECGPYEEEHPVHDIDLDCGDDTFEYAIITLAQRVLKHYGDYTPLEYTEQQLQKARAFIEEMRARSAK